VRLVVHRAFRLAPEREAALIDVVSQHLRGGGDCRTLGPRRARALIERSFSADGWASRVPVLGSNLTISFLRQRTAVCLQLGNVARTYADLLKLQALFAAGRIEDSVIVVPDENLSRDLGSNHASFDRLEREFELFSEVINVPALLVGAGD
jgi:hypothetical protein